MLQICHMHFWSLGSPPNLMRIDTGAAPMRILVVEDQTELAAQIVKRVDRAGYSVDAVATLSDARALIDTQPYSIALLDRRLPDGDGLSLVPWIQAKRPGSRILMMTALDTLDDRIEGLDAGADDYLVKPFSLDELMARIRAISRRSEEIRSPSIIVGALAFDLESRTALVEGRAILLHRRERALLEALVRRAERVVRRDTLICEIYSADEEIQPQALTILVSRLRARLDEERAGVEIHTTRGVGYMIAKRLS
jgi:two-component system OmpR family response regulator